MTFNERKTGTFHCCFVVCMDLCNILRLNWPSLEYFILFLKEPTVIYDFSLTCAECLWYPMLNVFLFVFVVS